MDNSFRKNSQVIRITALAAIVFFAAAGLSAQAAKEATRVFIDSAGRSVEVPLKLERIAPSGILAQIILYSLVPNRIVGWASALPQLVKNYTPKAYWDLPVFGQFYGKNVSLNLEALIAARPDVIIDIGEAKKTVKEDMDAIQRQLGIPVVFIEATLDTFPRAYTMLGELSGEKAAAEILSRYCAAAVDGAKRLGASVPDAKKVRIYYGEGLTGLNTNPAGSIHADVIELIGAKNVVQMQAGSGSGSSQVTMEQLLLWNPDMLIMGPDGAYDAAKKDPLWKDLAAVRAGRVYEVPAGPYNWMARPPAVNRLMGIFWLGSLVYPREFSGDLAAKAKEFYKIFYHYELSDAEIDRLLARSR